MTPYYQDDQVILYHGDAVEVAASLSAESVHLLLTDPPYFRVKAEDWDRQWKSRGSFLEWMGSWMDAVEPALTANASLYVFASPQLTSYVEQLVAGRWEVLNVIRWVKEQGWHQKARAEDLREFLSPWEGIVFAQSQSYNEASFGRYLRDERTREGSSCTDVELALGLTYTNDPAKGTKLFYRWQEGSSVPTKADYERVRQYLNRNGGDYLRREYEDLRLRRPFRLSKSHPRSDIWTFSTVAAYTGKHPCEKPTSVLEYMVTASSRPGDTVLDLFAGSGSTLLAARNNNRRAIGVEVSEAYCELIARRFDQGTFNFGESA